MLRKNYSIKHVLEVLEVEKGGDHLALLAIYSILLKMYFKRANNPNRWFWTNIALRWQLWWWFPVSLSDQIHTQIIYLHSVWKSPKMSHLNCSILAFSTIFWPIKTDLSGNTVWPQASGFQKLAKMDNFWHFQLTFVHSKCKRSSLRSQCWKRLFLWFSNTVR